MSDNSCQPDIKVSVNEEISEGRKWQLITIEDKGSGWVWDDMPKQVREKYLKARNFVEAIGGKFSYHAIPQEGAKVVLSIPFRFALNREDIEKLISRWAKSRLS